jgi:NAD(P) transhydrogenase subunit alpha
MGMCASRCERTRRLEPATQGETNRPRACGGFFSGILHGMEAFVAALTVFVLAIFLGFEVITKVPPTLHTPLMSGSNAISGITILGAILSAGAQHTTLSAVLGTLAVALATINVMGGFLVTDRMLQMFKPSRRELPDRQVK